MMELIDCGRLWAWLWLPSLLQPCLENRRTVLSLTFHLFIPERCTQLFSPGTFCWFFLLCKVEKKTFFGGWLLTTDESVGENGWRTHTKEATRSRGIITVKLLLRVPANYWLNKWTTRSSFSLWSFRTLNVVLWQKKKAAFVEEKKVEIVLKLVSVASPTVQGHIPFAFNAFVQQKISKSKDH